MAKTRDYMDYLDDSIGIAPAYSQEEYQASEVISQIMREHGIETSVEEFDGQGAGTMVRDAVMIIMFLSLLVGGLLQGAPHMILLLVALVAAGLQVYAHFVRNVFGLVGGHRKSQNVVGVRRACAEEVVRGSRPIVVVAHYDTPRESVLRRPGIARYEAMLLRIGMFCPAVVAVSLLFQIMMFLPETVRMFMWVVGLIASLPALLAAVTSIISSFGPCTLGANDNKSSVAALLSMVNRVNPADDRAAVAIEGRHAPRKRRLAEEPVEPVRQRVEVVEEVKGVRHGEEVLRSLAILPASCEITYEEPRVTFVEEQEEPAEFQPEEEQVAEQPHDDDDLAYDDDERFEDDAFDDYVDDADDFGDEFQGDAADEGANNTELENTDLDSEDFEEGDEGTWDDGYDQIDNDELEEEDSYDESFDDGDRYDDEYDDEEYDDEYGDEYDDEYGEEDAEGERDDAPIGSSIGSWFSERFKAIRARLTTDDDDEDWFDDEDEDAEGNRNPNEGEDEAPDAYDEEAPEDDEEEPLAQTDESDDDDSEFLTDEDEEYLTDEEYEEAESEPEESLDEEEDYEADYDIESDEYEDDYLEDPDADFDEYLYEDEVEEDGDEPIDRSARIPSLEDEPSDEPIPNIDEALQAYPAAEEFDTSDPDAMADMAFDAELAEEYASDFEYDEEYDQIYNAQSAVAPVIARTPEVDVEYDDDELLDDDYELLDDGGEEDLETDVYDDELLDSDDDVLMDPYDSDEGDEGSWESSYDADDDEPVRASDRQQDNPSIVDRILGLFRGGKRRKASRRAAVEDESYDDANYDDELVEDDSYGTAYEGDDYYLDDGEDGSYDAYAESREQESSRDARCEEDAHDANDYGELMEDEEYCEEYYEDEYYEEEETPQLQDPNLLHFDREQDDDIVARDDSGLSTISDSYDLYADDVARESRRSRPAAIEDPTWGTSTYQPARPAMNIGRRAALYDLPDPSGKTIDPLDDDYEYEDDVPATREEARNGGARGGFWNDDRDARASSWKGGATLREDLRDADELFSDADMQDAMLELGDEFLDEHDIWFVATGASDRDHAGIKAFLDAHRRELRGAFLVNLECVGAGSLAVYAREGMRNRRRADRRLVNLITSIARDLHIPMDTAMYDWDETDAATAMRARVRSVTIVGLDENDLPALSHTLDDVPENVNPEQVDDVVRIVTEIVRRA